MIREAYCSYEVAKLLKEKGFNEKCRGGYHSEFDDNGNPIVMFEEWMAQPYNNDFVDEGFLCSAPTHQMAMKWLREKEKLAYNILIIADGDLGDLHYSYEIQEIDNELLQANGSLDTEDQMFDNYEEAVEAALKYTLEKLI